MDLTALLKLAFKNIVISGLKMPLNSTVFFSLLSGLDGGHLPLHWILLQQNLCLWRLQAALQHASGLPPSYCCLFSGHFSCYGEIVSLIQWVWVILQWVIIHDRVHWNKCMLYLIGHISIFQISYSSCFSNSGSAKWIMPYLKWGTYKEIRRDLNKRSRRVLTLILRA